MVKKWWLGSQARETKTYLKCSTFTIEILGKKNTSELFIIERVTQKFVSNIFKIHLGI